MTAIAAILKFFKRHFLPNRKSDWAKTWWEALQWHKDSELLKSFQYLRWPPRGSNGISSKIISQIKPKLDGRYRSDIEIQNCLNSSIPISKMAAMTAILKIISNDISSQAVSRIEPKHDEKHHSDTEIHILLESYSSDIQPPRGSSWISSNDISPKKIDTWLEILERYRDSEWLNCSIPLSKMVAMTAILTFFIRPPEP